MRIKYEPDDIKLELWENDLWLTLFSISFSYVQPKNKLNNYIKFIISLGLVIPHKQYRKIFNYLIHDVEPLTVQIVSDKIIFTKYLYKLMKVIHKIFNLTFIFNSYNELENHFLNNYGLMTDYWGPRLWKLLHAITFNYNKKKRICYYIFFKLLGYIIICVKCRKSYNYFITKDKNIMINETIFLNKENFSRWLYNLHNKVNEKLDKNINVSYNHIAQLYIGITPNSNVCMIPHLEGLVPYLEGFVS
jgi:hypothetical protein